MTYRRLGVLVDGLPPESATKTAIRDEMDPLEMAAASGVPRPGWGPHTYTDDILCRIGEQLGEIGWILVRANSESTPPPPEPWRRPGVLSARERAEAEYERMRPAIDDLEAIRADLRRRKAQARMTN